MERVDGVGEASIFRGDPRTKVTDMDSWYTTILESHPATIAKRPYLYGSDAGFCARRNVLVENNTWLDANLNAAGAAFMTIGVALENLLAESLRRSDNLLVQGARIQTMKELFISGKMDLVVFDSQGELALVEVKTCGELPTEPKPAHLAQIQTYSAVTGIRRSWLTYISRRIIPLKPLQLRTFQVDTSDAALAKVLTIAAVSRLAADAKVLPPMAATFRKHTECHYCEFRDHFCWGGKGEEPVSPMRELTPAEYVGIVFQGATLADALVQDCSRREQVTISNLLELQELSQPNRAKLQQLAI